MTTGTEPRAGSEGSTRTASIIAICYSEELVNKVGKQPRQEAHVTQWGIPGDAHYGETRWSASSRSRVPNNRPITVVGYEAARDACEKLGCPEIPAGETASKCGSDGRATCVKLSVAKPGTCKIRKPVKDSVCYARRATTG